MKKAKLPCLVVISAPSGAGKTTLCSHLLSDFPELTLSISSTTRAPRGSEQNGKEYFFLTRQEFETKIAAGNFAEWALVHGNYYGTSKDTLERCFAMNQSVLLDIDVQGSASFRQSYPDRNISIFIAPPDLPTLEARLRARGTDTEETIQRRMKNAAEEMTAANHFDHVIVNGDLETAYKSLFKYVSQYLRGTPRG